MERVRECRHKRVMKRQKAKFEALIQQKQGGCSNQGQVSSSQMNRDMDNNGTEDTKKWLETFHLHHYLMTKRGYWPRGQSFPSGPDNLQSVNMWQQWTGLFQIKQRRGR